MYRFRKQGIKSLTVNSNSQNPRNKTDAGFTLVEVVAALLILSMILSSVMVIMNQISSGMIDLRAETQAFGVARRNMERLLTSTEVSDRADYGIIETNPDIDWQTVVEPFYEPISNRMWIRGVCSAGYTDSNGQRKTVELTCWLTGLTAAQIKQILEQQRRIEELMQQFSETDSAQEIFQQRRINIAFLEYKGLDVDAYKEFTEQIERRRIDYIAQNGFDDEYELFVAQLTEEETTFLFQYKIVYDDYVYFYETYDPQVDYRTLREQQKQLPAQDGSNAEEPTEETKTEEDT
jgi:prepilin-type N-terminal cleavage/methylation domain-containing protein